MNLRTFSASLLLLFVGCSHSPSDAKLGDAANSDATTSGDATSGIGPEILNLSTNTMLMTSSDQLVVSAVVTDPAGIQQVIGGTLSDSGSGTYGAFEVSTTNGAWSITLTWQAIETVEDITGPVGGVNRTFVATFYDQAGHTTSRTVTVALSCGANDTTDSLCSGQCFDLQIDGSNCGTCGRSCTGGSCVTGTCAALTACALGSNAGSNVTCADVCSAQGATCTNACVGVDGLVTGAVVWGTDSTCNTFSTTFADNVLCTDLVTLAASYECCCAS